MSMNEAKRKHIEEVLEDYIDVLLDNPSTSASAGYNVEAAQREVNELASQVEKLRGQRDALEMQNAALHGILDALCACEADDGEKGTCRERLKFQRLLWCRGCENAARAVSEALAAAKDGGDD